MGGEESSREEGKDEAGPRQQERERERRKVCSLGGERRKEANNKFGYCLKCHAQTGFPTPGVSLFLTLAVGDVEVPDGRGRGVHGGSRERLPRGAAHPGSGRRSRSKVCTILEVFQTAGERPNVSFFLTLF